MIQIFWFYSEICPVLPYVLQLFVSTQRLSHVKCVFTSFSSRRIVAVVVDYSPEDAVAVAEISSASEFEHSRGRVISCTPQAFI